MLISNQQMLVRLVELLELESVRLDRSGPWTPAEPSNVVDVENASKAILSAVAAVAVVLGGCARPPSTSAPAREKPAAVRFAEGSAAGSAPRR
ncbi:hypothetical protein I552_7324 [Mycobacterium xenopi 3993]|nr:hypothetical protein I552_7324 [Mycobacterium xenopi 3993]